LKLGKEYSDLEEIWKSEKAQVQGSAHIKEEIDKLKAEIVKLQREGKLDKVAELQYGKLPQLDAQLKAAEKAGEGAGRRTSCCAPRSGPRKLPRWFPAPPASRSARCCRASATSS
jgi:ATP-dependent Clp protease ATP-binding subunit ClpB